MSRSARESLSRPPISVTSVGEATWRLSQPDHSSQIFSTRSVKSNRRLAVLISPSPGDDQNIACESSLHQDWRESSLDRYTILHNLVQEPPPKSSVPRARHPPVDPRRTRRFCTDFGLGRDKPVEIMPAVPTLPSLVDGFTASGDSETELDSPSTDFETAPASSDASSIYSGGIEYEFPKPPTALSSHDQLEAPSLRRMRSSPVLRRPSAEHLRDNLASSATNRDHSRCLSRGKVQTYARTSYDVSNTSIMEEELVTLLRADPLRLIGPPPREQLPATPTARSVSRPVVQRSSCPSSRPPRRDSSSEIITPVRMVHLTPAERCCVESMPKSRKFPHIIRKVASMSLGTPSNDESSSAPPVRAPRRLLSARKMVGHARAQSSVDLRLEASMQKLHGHMFTTFSSQRPRPACPGMTEKPTHRSHGSLPVAGFDDAFAPRPIHRLVRSQPLLNSTRVACHSSAWTNMQPGYSSMETPRTSADPRSFIELTPDKAPNKTSLSSKGRVRKMLARASIVFQWGLKGNKK
ncbi:hypothetical protein FISHEDRAFT_77553 [Fistulina hepatica ATCC 64428]|uniref:Uncharacterized protein n=1 Tax=Fistulina hepatica ATCC 64428 TaxID=1128425 RepID=A0A0D7A0V1_9AGAR|nr:hypothetical protein FISHEDRAFT_77553 [Fistulina hepatica ATCC 64428]